MREHGGCHTEGDEVGERIVFLPEFRGRVGPSSDAPIERVEHGRGDDQDRRRGEVSVDRAPDRQVSAEKVPDGEERRQKEETARQALAREPPPAHGRDRDRAV